MAPSPGRRSAWAAQPGRSASSATIVALAGVVFAGRRAHGLERRQYAIVLVGASVVVVNAIVGVLVPAVTDQRSTVPRDSAPRPCW